MRNRKAQMEILGLAIVVVLILVATTFVVRFLMLKVPTEYRKGFISEELAKNMVNSLLKTTASQCSKASMSELLKDCAQVGEGSWIICDNHQYSCKYFNETAKYIFGKTLVKWNMNYQFLAYVDINKPLINLGKRCVGEKTSSNPWPIPINFGTMYVKLDICG